MLRVVDGDTIENEDIKHYMRLYGIDAPELDQPHGIESGHALHNALKPHAFGLSMKTLKTGPYGRSIIILEYKDKSIGTTVQATMVRSGAAWVDHRYCTRPECESWKQLERLAREAKRGLWSDDDPIPPWVWRRNQ